MSIGIRDQAGVDTAIDGSAARSTAAAAAAGMTFWGTDSQLFAQRKREWASSGVR